MFLTLAAMAGSWGIVYDLIPKFEIENTTQIRFRNWILAGLVGGTIVAVIAGLIVDLIIRK